MMQETPTAYTMQYTTGTPTYSAHFRKCDKCSENARNFIELYNPRTKSLRTFYLCDSCQAKLCGMIGLFMQGNKE